MLGNRYYDHFNYVMRCAHVYHLQAFGRIFRLSVSIVQHDDDDSR